MKTEHIVIGILALALFAAWKRKRDQAVGTPKTDVEGGVVEIPIGKISRPTGMIPCPKNPAKMYDPNVAYFVNPCL